MFLQVYFIKRWPSRYIYTPVLGLPILGRAATVSTVASCLIGSTR